MAGGVCVGDEDGIIPRIGRLRAGDGERGVGFVKQFDALELPLEMNNVSLLRDNACVSVLSR